MVAAVDVDYLTRDVAATHPDLTAPARAIGMRAQSEAEKALDRGDSTYTGMSWATPRQIWINQVIPLPAPARHGLVNLSEQVIAASIKVEAAAAPLRPSGPEHRPTPDRGRPSRGSTSPKIGANAPRRDGPRR